MTAPKMADSLSKREKELVAEIRTLKSQLAQVERTSALTPREDIEQPFKFPEQNPYPVFRVATDGTLLYANPACENLLLDLNGQTSRTLPKQWLDLVRSAFRSRTIERVEFQHRDCFIAFTAVPVNNASYTNVYVVDITDRKNIELEQDLILNLLHLVNGQTDLESTLRDVTALLRQFSGCEAVGVRLRDGFDYPYYETQGFPAEFVKSENSLCTVDQAGEVIRDTKGDPIIECMCGNVICGRFDPSLPFFTERGSFWSNCTTDLLASTGEADRQTRTRNRCNGQGYESVALIPLRTGDEVFGLLQFNDTRKRRFSHQTVASFERIAQNLVASLAHQKVTEELRSSEQKLAEAQAMAHIGNWNWDIATNQITWSREMYRIYGLAQDQILSIDLVCEMIYPEDRLIYDYVLSKLHDSGSLPEFIEYRIVDKHGQMKWIHAQADAAYSEDGKLTRLRGTVQDITERKLTEQQVLYNQTQLKSLASELVLAEERERDRLAVHLHDNVCQNLAYVKMKLQIINAAMDDKAKSEQMTDVIDALTEVMNYTRSLSFELSSPVLTMYGLEAAISQWLTQRIEQMHGIVTEFLDDGQAKPLEDNVQAMLFRSIRELLANVVKHSHATQVEVAVSRVEGQILIQVEDDGVGFDPDKVVVGCDTGGFGLFSIRERLSQLGGSLQIDSSLGQGCKTLLRAPLQQP